MRAMILAAGRGERLRPLTDTCPKPLIPLHGKPLIVYHLENLKAAGVTDIVINVFYLGHLIQSFLGNGEKWGVNITYSVETSALEVGGGIVNALSLLGNAPFLLINGDIWTDFSISQFVQTPHLENALAHLVLVKNPPQHPFGDFGFLPDGNLTRQTDCTYTYSGIAKISPMLFEGHCPGEHFPLAPLFDKAILRGKLTGEYFPGEWTDVGTLDRLQNLEKALALNTSPSFLN